MTEQLHKRIPVLDSVRGLAAFWVFLSHSFGCAQITTKVPILGDGRAGVDIFMILSGFLMFHLYRNVDFGASLGRFWTARFFRISPVYYFLLALSAAAIPNIPTASTSYFLVCGSYLFGFLPQPSGTGMPDWSIALEMQFYVTFPILAVFLRNKGWLPLVSVSAGLSVIFHLLWSVYTINPPGIFGTFCSPTLLPFKLPMFLLGGFFSDPCFFRNIRHACLFLALNFIGVAFPACLLTGYKSSVVIYISCISIVYLWKLEYTSFQSIISPLRALLSSSSLRFFGDISYSVYLIHAYIFTYFSGMLVNWLHWDKSSSFIRVISLLIICGPIIYLLSWIMYRCIESPCISIGRKISWALFPGKQSRIF